MPIIRFYQADGCILQPKVRNTCMVGKYKTENNKLTEKYKVLFCHALSNNQMHKIKLDKNHLDILTLFVNSVVLLDVAFYF